MALPAHDPWNVPGESVPSFALWQLGGVGVLFFGLFAYASHPQGPQASFGAPVEVAEARAMVPTIHAEPHEVASLEEGPGVAPRPVSPRLAASAEEGRPPPCPTAQRIPFPSGSSRPPSLAVETFQPLVHWVATHEDERLLVEGHSDGTGDPLTNLALSEKRAQSVAKVLDAWGVPAERMRVRAFGSFDPEKAVAGDSPDNRRVVIRLAPTKHCIRSEEVAP